VIVLTAGDGTAGVDRQAGGRRALLVVGGAERLVTGPKQDDPLMWGRDPMAYWTGRLRRGRVHFEGRTCARPIGAEPHAMRGTVYRRAWVVDEEGSMATGLGADWSFAGHARQRISLVPGRLRCRLELHADGAPAGRRLEAHVVGPDALLVPSMELSWSA
jgi:galactose mutarotase-like enzyme